MGVIKKTYAVFGLGRYGRTVARELAKNGAEVMAVDIDENIVNGIASELPICKCADVTDAEVIDRLGISNIDVVIICMAGRLEESVMAVMLCKEAGVGTVIAKASSEMNRRVLLKVGADKVVFPESEAGARLAKNLLSSGFVDIIELSDDVSLVELDVESEWIGKSLIELDLRRKYSLNVVAIRKNGEVMLNISPEEPLDPDMKLIVIANIAKLEKMNAVRARIK